MMRPTSIGRVVFTTILSMPVTVAAQTGTVVTSPVGASAPAVGAPMRVVLALALAVVTMYALRRRSARATVAVVLLAATTALAGITYATNANVVVSGDQCTRRTTQTWNSVNLEKLDNQCANDLLIRALDAAQPTRVRRAAAALPSRRVAS